MAVTRFALLCLFIGLAGCNSRPAVVPAKGSVLKADGTPFRGSIYFLPTDNLKGFSKRYGTLPFGLVDDEGQFEMGLDGNAPGIPPGEYRVMVNPRADVVVPERYTGYENSPWTVTIPRNGKTDIELKIEN